MEVTDGNLSWAATLDISGISKAKDSLVKYFRDMGLSAEEAGRRADAAMKQIEDTVSQAMSSVETDAEAMEVLKGALEEIQEKIESMEDGEAKEFLGGIAEGIEDIVEQMQSAQGVEMPLDGLEEGYTSAREAMRQMREELIRMKMAGQEGTEEYQRLLEKLGNLQDAMADTQQATRGMASDTQNLDAVMGAAQLTAGGFSAIMGAMNLVSVGEDTKELAEAQKKLQSMMAITTGLMSVRNALQKQSAVMLGITRLQTLAAAKAEAVKAAATERGVIATKAATLAQKAFNVVAKANPYVLLAMAILSVIGALVAFTNGTKEAERQQKSLNDELERQLSILNKLSGVYNTMQSNEINKLNNILDLLKAQGASIDAVRDAEDQLDKAEKARIDAEKEEFKDYLDNAQMYEDKLKELQGTIRDTNKEGITAKNAVERMNDAFLSTDYSTWEVPFDHPQYIADKTDAQVDQALEDLETTQKIVDKIHQIQQDEDNYETRIAKRQAERDAEDKKRREDAYRDASEKRKQNLEEEKRYQDELRKARERAEDLELDSRTDNINTRVAKAELDYERQISEAQRKADEARAQNRLELAEQYERQVSALMKKRDAEINKLYADEAEAQEQALAEMLDNYKGYDARKKAIEAKFQEDIRKLTEKRNEYNEGSEEWTNYEQAITEALQQQESELQNLEIEYGELNQLAGKRESLEKQILIVANKIKNAGTDEEKEALAKEMARLKSELRQVNIEIDEMNKSLEEAEDKMGEISATDIIDVAHNLTEAFAEMSGASKKTADDIGIMADGISSIASGYAQGGIAGAIIGGVVWAIDGMRNLAEQTAKENEELANFRAELDKIHQSFHIDDRNFNTIFGEDAIGRIEVASGAISNFTEKVRNLLQYYTDGSVGSMWDFASYRIEGLHNQNLEEIAAEWGLNLWDDDGGFNTDFIQKVLDQYGEELSENEKKLLQGMLNYSQAYQDAMAEIASYLQGLFGKVADTIADQFLDSFLKGEQAAVDFGAVVSDVAKQMAKDFIKNMLMEKVFNDLSSDFKAIMDDGSLSPQEKQQYLLAWLSAAQAQAEELQPKIQAYLEAMSQFFGAGEDVANAAMSGNLLQSASQDSVDLLNGQLNAVRTNQALMVSRVDSVILQLSGIYDEVRDFHDDSNTKLNQLIDNTSERGSIARAFGLA